MKRNLLAEVHEPLAEPRMITLPIANFIARYNTTKTLTTVRLIEKVEGVVCVHRTTVNTPLVNLNHLT